MPRGLIRGMIDTLEAERKVAETEIDALEMRSGNLVTAIEALRGVQGTNGHKEVTPVQIDEPAARYQEEKQTRRFSRGKQAKPVKGTKVRLEMVLHGDSDWRSARQWRALLSAHGTDVGQEDGASLQSRLQQMVKNHDLEMEARERKGRGPAQFYRFSAIRLQFLRNTTYKGEWEKAGPGQT